MSLRRATVNLIMSTTIVEQTKESCEASLRSSALVEVADALQQLGVDTADGLALVNSISESADSQRPMAELKTSLVKYGIDIEGATFEQFLLVQSALHSLELLPTFPVSDAVKKQICRMFQFFANPVNASQLKFQVGEYNFVAMCKLAALRRFPSGQLDWEVSGLPRSWMLKIPPRSLPSVIYYVVTKLQGFAPVFFIHFGISPKHRWVLQEEETLKSYYQMAKALEMQPEVKGVVGSSWLHSPDTFAASPHLSWLNKPFLDNGGMVALMGPADPNCGVFHRSPERKKLHQAGKFNPTLGLVIWPRKEVIKWAAAHPELECEDGL